MTYKLTKTSQDADQYFGAVSLLLDGTDLQDKSLDTKAITVNGDAQVSTAQSKWNGSSLYFDGTGDYLTSPAVDGFDFDTDDFTIECWFYIAGNSSLDGTNERSATLVSTYPTSGTITGYALIVLGDGSATGTGVGFFTWQSGTKYTVTATTSIAQSTWHHVAVSRSGTTTKLFLNGTQIGSGTLGNQTINSSNPLTIGRLGYPNYLQEFNGYIDDLRITKGVARYTANFTPPTQPFKQFQDRDPHFNSVELLLLGDGANASTNIVDSSSTPKTISVVGNTQISTAQSKYRSSSLYFDGTGDYLTATSGSYFTFGTADFTVETWVWRDGAQTGFATIAGSGGGATAGTWQLSFDYDYSSPGNSTHKIEFVYGTAGVLLASTSAIADQTWAHVAVARESGVLRLFINGTLEASSSTSASITRTDIRIGLNRGSNIYFDGYLDDLRVTTGVARYTSAFTPTYPGTA